MSQLMTINEASIWATNFLKKILLPQIFHI